MKKTESIVDDISLFQEWMKCQEDYCNLEGKYITMLNKYSILLNKHNDLRKNVKKEEEYLKIITTLKEKFNKLV